jgi:hypothetical protein
MVCAATAFSDEQALSTEEAIAQKLNAVQVHYLVLESGAPFSYQRPDGRLVPAFFYQDAAAYFRDDLIEQSQINQASPVAAGLGDVYLHQGDDQHRFVLMANPEQLAQARRFNENPEFDQVPLFAVKHRTSGDFLTMSADSQAILPFFIESQRVARALSLMKAHGEDPEAWHIVAIPLSTIVNDLHTGRLDIQKVRFIGP